MAGHYLLLTFETAREAERARVRVAGHGARGGAARAARAAQSALPVQQPQLDQRAGGLGSRAARRMCEVLGDFLRRSLSLGARDRVALAEELALVERYLAIEQVRFGERLRGRDARCARTPSAAWCRRCCCSRWSRTPSSTASPTASRAGRSCVEREARDGDRSRSTVENPRDPDAPPRRGAGPGARQRARAPAGARSARGAARRRQRTRLASASCSRCRPTEAEPESERA